LHRGFAAQMPFMETVMTFKAIVAAIAAVIALVSIGDVAAAHDFKVGSIEVDHPWTRATPKGASVAGGYVKITNKGTQPDKLVGGSAEGAGRFEIHEMIMEGGIMKMRPVSGGLTIKPGESVELKPGSYHLMLMDLKSQLQQGKSVKGTLVFEKAGKVDIEYAVEAAGSTPKGHSGH
jgi:copper(I)-binding protein